MDKLTRGPTPPAEDVWPPPPLGDDPMPLSFCVEGMQITQDGDRLLVVNKSMHRLFAVEACLTTLTMPLSPWISYWTNPAHNGTLSGLLPYALSSYRSTFTQVLFLFTLSVLAGIWWLLTSVGNLGGVTLDRTRGTLKAGGRRERPMSEIKAVLIKKTPNPILGIQHVVSILWDESRSTNAQARMCFFGALRREDHAEEVAAAIARFARVPVRHQATRKPNAQMIESDL